MLYYNEAEDSIEFDYPWIRPVRAKLELNDDLSNFSFHFNKNYLRLSNIVAEGWELIDIFRSLLQISLMRIGMYMIHGAAVSFGDHGVLIPSFGNTGKTTSAWMLAKRGAHFLTDEFSILNSQGECFGFPCSSLVSAELIKKLGLRLSPRQILSLRGRDTRSRILSTRFAPGGIKLHPDAHFRTRDKVMIEKIAFLQNGINDVREIDSDEALTRLTAIQDYELNWRSNPFVIANAFFRPSFHSREISASEERIMRQILLHVTASYLVSSTDGLHFNSIEKIAKT